MKIIFLSLKDNCSETTAALNVRSWWSVDLVKIYSVERVCLLNINSDACINFSFFYCFFFF